MKLIVAGRFAGVPDQGGATWALLQYVLGLRRLGHDVLLLEPLATEPEPAVLACFRRVVDGFGLEGRAALLVGRRTVGTPLSYEGVRAFARCSDVILDESGVLRDEAILATVAARVYLDVDPAFTQLWHEVDGIDMGLDLHTHFVTVGLEIGRASPVPTCGRPWITTLPPVVLDHWPAGSTPGRPAFTTVGNWRGYGSVRHDGVLYGQRAHSMRTLIDLPAQTSTEFRVALAIDPAERDDIEALAHHGWRRTDPRTVAGTPDRYRRFVQASRAEIGIAKSGYVVSRCGWFSDRSACYLASGRPVVAQETGFSEHLPTGTGLLAFDDTDGAASAVDAVERDYRAHARAARAIAEEHLHSDRVLGALLEAL